MQVCCKCKIEKLLSEFYKNRTRLSGHNGLCKSCMKTYNREYYHADPKAHHRRGDIWRAKNIKRNQEYAMSYLKEHSCVKCGESDPIVLQFDHLSDKVMTISKAIWSNCSLNRLKKEIAKCQILCANCHQRKTAQYYGWYRSL